MAAGGREVDATAVYSNTQICGKGSLFQWGLSLNEGRISNGV
jgi:hypothetical protein